MENAHHDVADVQSNNSSLFVLKAAPRSRFACALVVLAVALGSFAVVEPVFATPNPPTTLTPDVFSQEDTAPKVDGSTGALTQTIQLDIPPGRNGLQPDLSLNYNSQNTDQDSEVGYGWSLTIPYIERLNKTGSETLYGPNAYFTSSVDGELALGATSTITGTSTVSFYPVAYWKFDESSGNASDATGNGNTLVPIDSPSYVSAKINNGIQLQESNTQVMESTTTNQTYLGFTGSFTAAGWVYFNSFPGGHDSGFVSKWDGATHEAAYEVDFHNGNNFEAGISTNGTSQTFGGISYSFSTGVWYYVAAVYSASAGTFQFYVNGSSIGTATGFPTSIYNSSAPFEVGNETSNGNSDMNGVVDEMGMWDEALSATDVAALYNGGAGIQYPFNAGTTTVPVSYLPRVDTGSLDTYTYSTSTNSWTMYDKKGDEYLFGASSQSQESATTSQTGMAETYKWMLEKEIDPNGNYVRYVYTKDDNQIYPSEIIYTGNGATDGPMTITFATTSRADQTINFLPGFEVDTDWLISQITAAVSSTTVRQYVLSYTTGNNGYRSLLSSVQESGWNASGVETTLPPWAFSYVDATSSFPTTEPGGDNGGDVYVNAQVNGNGIEDDTLINCNTVSGHEDGAIYPSGSITPPQVNGLCWASGAGNSSPDESGTRFVDINGSGKADIVQGIHDYTTNTDSDLLYLNNGNGTWTATTTWDGVIPAFVDEGSGFLFGTTGILGNITGTGLPDYVAALSGGVYGTYLANGFGWTSTSTIFSAPENFLGNEAPDCTDSQLVDVTGDGLDDWVYTDGTNTYVLLNNGTGWDSTPDSRWTIPTSTVAELGGNCYDKGARFVDVNGDGLPDFVVSYSNTNTGVPVGTYQVVYLNTGHGWATSTAYTIPYIISGAPYPDSVDYLNYENYLGNGQQAQDVIATTTNPKGGTTSVTYAYTTQSGTNPDLPYNLLVVTKVLTNDGLGHTQETDYAYGGGLQYLPSNDVFDRKFAGFASATTTTAQSTVVTYYSQGSTSTAVVAGDQSDGYGQMGYPYRQDTLTPSGNLVRSIFYQYDPIFHGNSEFVGLTRQLEQDHNSDGTTHVDKDTDYVYSTTTDDLVQTLDYGEVNGNSDGTFSTSSATSLRTTDVTYAASSSLNLSVPTEKTLFNSNSATTTDAKYFYDGLAFGAVNVGNQTEEEDWATSTTYASTTRTYNSYGLVATSTDADGNVTIYTYDAFDMYPSTTTDALSQSTSYAYNYSNGKIATTTDPNGDITVDLYDGVGRPTEVQESDIAAPTTLDIESTYQYTDSTNTPSSVEKIDYLNSTSTTATYDYYDGLDRLIQERKETGTSGTYAVTDTIYDDAGNTASTSLSYFSSGSARTSPASSTALFTSYTYDPLGRVLSTQDVTGSSTNSYSGWTTTSYDKNGNRTDYYLDAFGNLAEVIQYPSTPATTTYSYDAANDLTEITDANGNVRNFTYNGLGQRVTAQDLHVFSSTSFGTWDFTYDPAGNLLQTVDPKSQTVDYTYDALNRPVGEYLVGTGTTTTYAYDSCTNGIGRLCTASSTSALDAYAYDILGRTTNATTTVGGVAYPQTYSYDLQGDITNLIYPNGSQAVYTYNGGALQQTLSNSAPNGSSYSPILSSVDYAPTAQMSQLLFGSGATTTYTYDSSNLYRLIQLQTFGVSTTTTTATSSTAIDGIVDYWKLDETSGNASDSAGSNSLTNVNSLTYGPALINNGAIFAKADDQVLETSAAVLGTAPDNFSVSLWVKLNSEVQSTDSNHEYSFFYNQDNAASGDRQSIFIYYDYNGGSRILRAGVATNATYEVTKSGNLGTTSWHHIVLTDSSGTLTLYVDGVSQGTTVVSGSGTGSGPTGTWIGADSSDGTSRPTDGTIDEVGVWNRALNSSEITALYGSGFGLAYPFASSTTITTPAMIQNTTYTYDSEGNITGIADNSMTAASSSVVYAYDPLNRLIFASTTAAASNPYEYSYFYDPLGNITAIGPGGTANTYSLTLDSSSDQYISHADAPAYDITGDLTFETWVKLTSEPPTDATYSLINKCWDESDNCSYIAGYDDDGGTNRLIFDMTTNGTTNVNGAVDYTLSTGVWYHLAYVYSASAGEVDFYVNGTEVGSQIGYPTSIYNSTSELNAGYSHNSSHPPYFDGELDDYRLWNIDRTAAQIADYQDQQLTGAETGLAAYYEFNNNYNDSTSNENTLTATNNPTFTTDVPFTGTGGGATSDYTYGGTGFPNPDAVTQIGNGTATSTFSYDADGNLTQVVSGATTTTYVYDYKNRLIATGINGATTTYGYDYQGNRVYQAGSGSTTTYPNMYYSLFTDGTTATSTQYLYANNLLVSTVDQALSSGVATGTPIAHYIHSNNLGSTEAVTDQNMNVVQALGYYPFGATRVNTGTSTDLLKQYIGQYSDTSGLSYLNARYYDPAQGQFLTEDPIFLSSSQDLKDPQSLNPYAYSEDNPISGSDPTGKNVYLVSRPVFDVGGFDVGAHTFFEAVPNDPSQIQMAGLPYGTTAFTLGAYPDQLSNPLTSQLSKGMGTNDSLAYDSEYAFGNEPTYNKIPITPPNGESDTEFIDKLGQAYNDTNVKGVGYWFMGNTPGLYNGNSNNFTYTLGTEVGVQQQMNEFNPNPSGNIVQSAPGYGTSLPATSIIGEIESTIHSIETLIGNLAPQSSSKKS